MFKNYLIEYYPNGWFRVYSYYDEELSDANIMQKDSDIKEWYRNAFHWHRIVHFIPITNLFIFGYSNSWWCWIQANSFQEAIDLFFESYKHMNRKTRIVYEV